MIILEGIILISIVFSLYFLACIEDKTILIVLLTFAACEAAIGLSLLISFIRIRRNSYLNSLSLHTWFLFSLKKILACQAFDGNFTNKIIWIFLGYSS